MHCENAGCVRPFRNGDIVYALPIRLVIVRNGNPTFNILEKRICGSCWQETGHTPLDRQLLDSVS